MFHDIRLKSAQIPPEVRARPPEHQHQPCDGPALIIKMMVNPSSRSVSPNPPRAEEKGTKGKQKTRGDSNEKRDREAGDGGRRRESSKTRLVQRTDKDRSQMEWAQHT